MHLEDILDSISLIDQFLRDGSNQRTDRYGGTVGNRARFLLEIVDRISQVWESGRIGVRIAPHFQGDIIAWEKWNKLLVRQLKESQLPDGSFRGQFGPSISTSLSLLSLALNYRFLPIYER